MDKTQLELIIHTKAKQIFNNKKQEIATMIGDFLSKNPGMNAHESGNSLSYELQSTVDTIFSKRYPEIIRKLESIEMTNIINRLDSIKFIFEEAP